ncbi:MULTISPECIES: SIR2 family NAD-dependent protein deacylase [Methylobacterium]|uniref:SIR2 family NAD-dependent protein deacylase n=1 Tax=Methylobacterium TaxID=407 RepID=UPI0009E72ADD|nr:MULTISPECIES: SIR2 family protein [Methylobacterium]MCI9880708.1 SIR2 family protein [Methylobacterium goesingense]
MSYSTNYDEYKTRISLEIKDLISRYQCQPILFVGAGLSRRYFSAPSWHDALRFCVKQIDDQGPDYQYYVQKHDGDTIKIGSLISQRVHDWAWKGGKNKFPSQLFSSADNGNIFIKHMLADHLIKLMPSSLSTSPYSEEIEYFKKIRPHAVITTNYDTLLEHLFEGYEAIVGENVLKYNSYSFGEIYKIHGSVSEPETMVLTEDDYKTFVDRKQYLSAKLLTYFIEHPIFIFGYGFQDPNIQAIIENVGKIISSDSGTIRNIYYVKWDALAAEKTDLQSEHLIASNGQNFRVKAIVTDSFDWIFRSLAVDGELKSVNTKLVRALAARAFKLIRNDIPKGQVNVNYEVLERVAELDSELPTLLGITQSDNMNAQYPFVITQIAEMLGYKSWNPINKMILQIKKETGVDIKASDNKYHCRVKTGKKSYTPKYSHLAVDLIKKVHAHQKYECTLD